MEIKTSRILYICIYECYTADHYYINECKKNICLNDNYIHKSIDILEDICPTRGFCLGVISYRYACGYSVAS